MTERNPTQFAEFAGTTAAGRRAPPSTAAVRRSMWLLFGFALLFALTALGYLGWTTYRETTRAIEEKMTDVIVETVIPFEILLTQHSRELDTIVLEEWEPAIWMPGQPNRVFFDRHGLPIGVGIPEDAYKDALLKAREISGGALSETFLRGGEWRALMIKARRGLSGEVRGFVGIEFPLDTITNRWRNLRTPERSMLSISRGDSRPWLRYMPDSQSVTTAPDPSLKAIAREEHRADTGNQRQPGGATRYSRSRDGATEWLVAWREIGAFDLTIAVSVDTRRIFAHWRRGNMFPFLVSLGVTVIGLCLVGLVVSIVIRETQRREASISQLQMITDGLPVLIAYLDTDQRFRFINGTGAEWCAQPPSEFLGRTLEEVRGSDYYFEVRPYIDGVLNGNDQSFEDITRYGDGVTRNARITFIPHRGAAGEVRGFFALEEDLTEIKHTEERLRHAAKMEAVGQLTGGVAHDFNNLLMVVQGNLELLVDQIEPERGKARQFAAAALGAAKRGASLTSRLLAFARKQPLRPAIVNLNRQIEEMTPLVRRALRDDIDIHVSTSDHLWSCKADPSQIENMLLNLSINARDAMPHGGTITIETRNAMLDQAMVSDEEGMEPGEYVFLSVGDTGTGMTPEVLKNVFDPFFTTKGSGEGTGLGLSMAHGFVRQSGGCIRIESTLGEGTTVLVYLPRAREDARVDDNPAKAEGSYRIAAGETVLVVDDDELVRSTTKTLVSELGYQALEADDGPSAITVLEKNPDIRLLFTDIVMPGGMNGFQLASAATKLNPNLKLLFTSGHVREYDAHTRGAFEHYAILQKPYQKQELERRLRELLDNVA